MNEKYTPEQLEKIKRQRIYEPEFQAILALYETRTDLGITQQELSKMSGIRQSNISRIERGTCSPTIKTLSELAYAMGKKLEIKIKWKKL